MEFMGLFGRGETGTLLAGVDYGGGASLASLAYDVQERVVRPIASPHGTKFSDPVSLAVGEAPLRHGQGSRAASSLSPAGTEAGRLDAASTTACSGGSPSTRRAAGQQAGPCAACSHAVDGSPYLGRHQPPPLAARTPTTRRLSTPTSHNSLELGMKGAQE
jgi:hypothetical protein